MRAPHSWMGCTSTGPSNRMMNKAGVVSGRRVPHRLPGREMAVRARADDLLVDLETAFEDHDGVRGCMPMETGLQPSRIQDEIVLRPRGRILVQEPQVDLSVVDD